MTPGDAPVSFWYMTAAVVNCLRLLTQFIWWAFCFARDRAGSNIAARIAMIAITTSSSISVKALRPFPEAEPIFRDDSVIRSQKDWFIESIRWNRPFAIAQSDYHKQEGKTDLAEFISYC